MGVCMDYTLEQCIRERAEYYKTGTLPKRYNIVGGIVGCTLGFFGFKLLYFPMLILWLCNIYFFQGKDSPFYYFSIDYINFNDSWEANMSILISFAIAGLAVYGLISIIASCISDSNEKDYDKLYKKELDNSKKIIDQIALECSEKVAELETDKAELENKIRTLENIKELSIKTERNYNRLLKTNNDNEQLIYSLIDEKDTLDRKLKMSIEEMKMNKSRHQMTVDQYKHDNRILKSKYEVLKNKFKELQLRSDIKLSEEDPLNGLY